MDMLIPMAQVLRLYIHMFPSHGLYVCINLETAHHRTTFMYFFLMGRSRTFLGIRIKFHLGRAKERGKRI